ncbi:MAG: succinoglycan biosynthesis transport protein ExoP [Gammaproteobacteria bacterium]|jgi:succinoglycan biosynthesis transport protein ExoP
MASMPPLQSVRHSEVDFEPDDESAIDLWEYWRLFRRHWISVGVIALAGLLIATWYANSLTPMYSSSVTVVIDPSRSNAPGAANYSYYYTQKLFYETQETVLLSREIAERTARKLSRLEKDKLTAPVPPGAFVGTVNQIKQAMRGWVSSNSIATQKLKKPIEQSQQTVRSESQLTRWGAAIQGGRRINPSQDSQVMSISFTSQDAEISAIVANLIADAYIEYTQESRESLSAQAGRWMAEQVERLRTNLTNSQNSLQEFQIREGLINLEDIQTLTSARLQTLNAELAATQKNFDGLSKRYGVKHPKLIQAKSELASAKRKLSTESQTIVLDTEKKFQLSKLENDVKSNREIYELFLNRFRQIDVTSTNAVSPIYMLDRAQVPSGPVSPNKQRMSILGLLGGFFLGFLLSWLREKLDNTFHNPSQLETELGLPSIGVVPLLGKEEKRFDNHMSRKRYKDRGQFDRFYLHNPKSPFAESINHIRTGVLYSSAENVPKTILVTSAIQSEGKTTLSTNLAIAFSQIGKTLLLDADLRKPRIHHMTDDKDGRNGLVEILIGRANLEESLIDDKGHGQLFVLKSGIIPPNPQEILSSKRFKDLLDTLEAQFDHIIIDCAPVLPVSDALVLSSKVDGLIFLVEANSTNRQLGKDALKRIRAVNAPVIGCVLSQFDHRHSNYYGRYNYYSKYYTYAYGKNYS